MGFTPARSSDLLLVALDLIHQRQDLIDTVSWSASSAALRRPQATSPSTSMAEGRLLRALTSACWRHLLFNLPAGVPTGRPFYCFSAACPSCSVPSGVVPGDGVDGRASRHQPEIGGEGLDRVFQFSFRVLSAILQGLLVRFTFTGRSPECDDCHKWGRSQEWWSRELRKLVGAAVAGAVTDRLLSPRRALNFSDYMYKVQSTFIFSSMHV
jgi:hypothetical protein